MIVLKFIFVKIGICLIIDGCCLGVCELFED